MEQGLTESVDIILQDWQTRLNADEWYFERQFDALLAGLQPWQAYQLIPEAVDVVLAQQEPFIVKQCFELLLELYTLSGTTQIPSHLRDSWEILVRHVSRYGERHELLIDELRSWLHHQL